MRVIVLPLLMLTALPAVLLADEKDDSSSLARLLSGKFQWQASAPLVGPTKREDDPCYSVKDASVVFHEGEWHVFMTIRSTKRSHQIEYISFADWKDANAAERQVLKLSDGYFCAPQVFYFTPHKKWYLIYQVNEPSRKPSLQPAFSTTENLADPASWTRPKLLFAEHPSTVPRWIDFWVICDEAKAHLFFTSNDGKMWRGETKLADFPGGWSLPKVVLEGDIFEASHTYRLRGTGKYLSLSRPKGEGVTTRRISPTGSIAIGSRLPPRASSPSPRPKT